jgi:hypothetical protein
MVIKHIARDENELDPVLGSLLAELLQCSKSGFADAVAGGFVESGDSDAKVQICRVQEPNHDHTGMINVVLKAVNRRDTPPTAN